VGVAAPGFVGIRTDSVADVWVPLTLQTPLGYAYNSSAYGASADRRKPWMDQDNIGWLNIVARVDRARQAEATTLLQSANARGLQRMAGTLADPRERSSTVARTLVVTSFARGFSGLRAVIMVAVLVVLALGVTQYDLPGWLLPAGLIGTGVLLKAWESRASS